MLVALSACGTSQQLQRPAALFAGVAGPLIIAKGDSRPAPQTLLDKVKNVVALGADWVWLDATLGAHNSVIVEFGDGGSFRERAALDEMLAIADLRVVVELQLSMQSRDAIEALVATIYRRYAADRVAIASASAEVLDALWRRDPSLPLVAIAELPAQFEQMLETPVAVLAVRSSNIEAARKAVPGTVAVWGGPADSVAAAEAAVERGAHGVLTYAPEAVVTAFRTPLPAVIPLSK